MRGKIYSVNEVHKHKGDDIMTIAQEILSQLGGRKFIACTGCKNFLTDNGENLIMNIPRNGSKANRLEVTYNHGNDTYNMRFYRHRNASYSQKRYIAGKDPWIEAKDTEVRTFNDVHCDQLTKLFTEVTGMIVPHKLIINGYTFG